MKALTPVFVVLALLLAFVSVVSAQEKVYNPDLPQNLVFQWQIHTPQVEGSWNNNDFSVSRDADGLVVYYGQYRSLEEALDGLPKLPKGVKKSDVKLIPFFNQRSISTEDALVLLGNRNHQDLNPGEVEEEQAVSFTVYFATFDQPQGRKMFEVVNEVLSFEVLPNYNFAYSAGLFPSLALAEDYATQLKTGGFPEAEVNKFLNGQRIAMVDEQLLYAYVAWVH